MVPSLFELLILTQNNTLVVHFARYWQNWAKRDQQGKTGEFGMPEYAITNLVILVHSGVVLFYGVLHVERSIASCTR